MTAVGVLVAWLLLATENNHRGEITDVVSQLVSLKDEQLAQLGMRQLPVERAYKRFHDKLSRVRIALEAGFAVTDENGDTVRFDLDWWTGAPMKAAIPDDVPSSRTLAVDGTDWETAGRFRSSKATVYDGDAPVDTDDDPAERGPAARRARRKARRDGWEIGDDQRAIHTTDRDARGGYRTATNGRKGGAYVGYEIHLGAQVRDFTWSGDHTRINDGPEVPGFVREAHLSPAGSHRANAIVPTLVAAATNLDTVVWDRGYSILPFERAHGPLLRAGIQTVFDLSTIQRNHPAVSDQVIWLDGHPFHEHTPEHLRELERPPMNATTEQLSEYQETFNERARWRWVRHSGPDPDGVTRWKCPFHAGRLKCRSIRQRAVARNAPLVTLPAGVRTCCEGTLSLPATYLNLIQAHAIPYGTTAHANAYGRRQIVETANSYLGGAYINLERSYSRLMGKTNRKFMLGVILAGLNRYIERSWRAKQSETTSRAATNTRAKRRTETFAQILGPAETGASTHRVAAPMRT